MTALLIDHISSAAFKSKILNEKQNIYSMHGNSCTASAVILLVPL